MRLRSLFNTKVFGCPLWVLYLVWVVSVAPDIGQCFGQAPLMHSLATGIGSGFILTYLVGLLYGVLKGGSRDWR